jgi:hypothetical protein
MIQKTNSPCSSASSVVNKCGLDCEIYSRVCGYFRPVANWNKGKQQEFKDRLNFNAPSCAAGASQGYTPPLKRSQGKQLSVPLRGLRGETRKGVSND